MAWDYDKTEYSKQAETDPVWKLERLINYGLGGERIKKEMLKKHLGKLKIPENRRVFFEVLLWNKKL